MIVIDDMRAAGKNGYVAKIVNNEKIFLTPTERTGYSTSRQQLAFELVDDGIYEVCDANFGSSKRNIYFIKIENRQQCDRAHTLAELVVGNEELPELKGSEKQIAWAHSIRAKFVARLKQANKEIPSRVKTETSAKFWIDNRAKAEGK